MREKPIFYPILEGDVPAYYDNAIEGLTTGGLGAKYGIVTGSITIVEGHNTDIPVAINLAEADAAAAKSSVNAKNELLGLGKTDLLIILHDINRSPILVEADAVTLGMRKSHTPPVPADAVGVISHHTELPDQNILDWVKKNWDGVIIEGSYDNVNWVQLDKADRSPFHDTRFNQVYNAPEKRYYRVRFYFQNVPIGNYSPVLQVVAQIYPLTAPVAAPAAVPPTPPPAV
jgi:hypothetical protein